MKNFLYIFEDGTVKAGPKPTNDDIRSVEDGCLSVIDMKRKMEYIPGQGWEDLEVVEQQDIEEEDPFEDEPFADDED